MSLNSGTKFIFVTGGVVSSAGKGIIAAVKKVARTLADSAMLKNTNVGEYKTVVQG